MDNPRDFRKAKFDDGGIYTDEQKQNLVDQAFEQAKLSGRNIKDASELSFVEYAIIFDPKELKTTSD